MVLRAFIQKLTLNPQHAFVDTLNRVLITEGKEAASEGRLAAALRNYETAMVTLPEVRKI